MDNWSVVIERDGVLEEPFVLAAEDLDSALKAAYEQAAGGEVHTVARVEQASPGEGSTPTDDPFVQTSPNGTLWRWTVTDAGTGKWIKV
jgi:hypothetical protein